ncbi:MAG TPA: type 4a pilus biogenesis protein PilO, partial [Actinomycetes bacterium]|nr:type 4a pilus biogenesis protein PilO [Actinomycetes bacterium]
DGDPVTRRNELILAGIGTLLVLVAATLVLIRPTRQATADAHAERDTAVSESQALRDQIKALEALKPNEAELRSKASLAKAEFPATPALPALVDALQDAASLSGVDLGTVAPSTPKASTASPLLAEITTTVNVSGGYFEIQDFLVRLENLVKGTDPGRIEPRSVLIESVNLNSADESATGDSAQAAADPATSADELTGSIVLTVFQLAQSSGTSSTPAAPAATASPGAQVR